MQFLISSLFQGSHILRHKKGEACAIVYKSIETTENYSLTGSQHIEITGPIFMATTHFFISEPAIKRTMIELK
jgi:hypothetical protein